MEKDKWSGLIIATFIRHHLFSQHSSQEDELQTAPRLPGQTRPSLKVSKRALGADVQSPEGHRFTSGLVSLTEAVPPRLTRTTVNRPDFKKAAEVQFRKLFTSKFAMLFFFRLLTFRTVKP